MGVYGAGVRHKMKEGDKAWLPSPSFLGWLLVSDASIIAPYK
jgi:hypothetical protein